MVAFDAILGQSAESSRFSNKSTFKTRAFPGSGSDGQFRRFPKSKRYCKTGRKRTKTLGRKKSPFMSDETQLGSGTFCEASGKSCLISSTLYFPRRSRASPFNSSSQPKGNATSARKCPPHNSESARRRGRPDLLLMVGPARRLENCSVAICSPRLGFAGARATFPSTD
jgi:hypothetical protein